MLTRQYAPSDYEVYDYPGGFGDDTAGSRVARLRMEEECAPQTSAAAATAASASRRQVKGARDRPKGTE